MSRKNKLDKYNYFGLPGCNPWDYKNKGKSLQMHAMYMINRTRRMFRYENLPDTIPERFFELYLQLNGKLCFAKNPTSGDLQVYCGEWSDVPDIYYMPTHFIVSNPSVKDGFSKSFEIDKECVIVGNDTMYLGLLPLFERYGTLLSESELSLLISVINMRDIDKIIADNDEDAESARLYRKHVVDGDLDVLMNTSFKDNGLVVNGSGNSIHQVLTDIIEVIQYVKASEFNELGLNANYNMKRESLNSAESQLNNDALLPLIDDMYQCRMEGIEKINSMFGTNIKVFKNSSWEDNQEELDAEQDAIDGVDDNEQDIIEEDGEEDANN